MLAERLQSKRLRWVGLRGVANLRDAYFAVKGGMTILTSGMKPATFGGGTKNKFWGQLPQPPPRGYWPAIGLGLLANHAMPKYTVETVGQVGTRYSCM